VLSPQDANYDQTRRAWNLALQHHPALILIAADAQDVQAAVLFAREAGLGVAVQLTGHGLQQTADDNLLIVTSRMTGVQVDAQARTARVEAGVLWNQVLAQASEHGLAPLLGSAPHVGVVGYTLGGGIGWLARKYGLAADSVRSLDVVTADGTLRHASATENSDLFWAIRGGGGGFGIVTAMEFALYPVSSLYGGELVYPSELAADALRLYREWIRALPDEMTSSISLAKFPNLPQLPEAIRGKKLVLLRAAYAGDAAQGQALIQPWLDWHTPLSDTFKVVPFAEVGTISNDPVNPTPSEHSNELLDTLSDDAIDVMVRFMTDDACALAFTELRHAGGAIARVDADANAIGNRDALLYMQMSGLALTPAIRETVEQQIQRYKDALAPSLRGNVYLNFLAGEEARRRAKDGYLPQTYARLVALKAKYDPQNLFRYSFQIALPETMQA
jgi:FAD/FMN-containing dehydrogenase